MNLDSFLNRSFANDELKYNKISTSTDINPEQLNPAIEKSSSKRKLPNGNKKKTQKTFLKIQTTLGK